MWEKVNSDTTYCQGTKDCKRSQSRHKEQRIVNKNNWHGDKTPIHETMYALLHEKNGTANSTHEIYEVKLTRID